MFKIFILVCILLACTGILYTQNNNVVQSYPIESISIFDSNCIAGTMTNGIFYGSTGGSIWLNSGLGNKFVSSLVRNDQFLFAGTQGGIYASSNNGQLWYPTPVTVPIQDMAINDSIIFVITTGAGNYTSNLLQSKNQGFTWSPTVIDSIAPFKNIALAVFHNNIYVGTEYGELYFSSNSGLNWMKSNLNNSEQIWQIGVLDTTVMVSTIGGGAFLSIDGANTWNSIGLKDTAIETIEIHKNTNMETQIFIGTWDGLFLSADFGVHWNHIGLEKMLVTDIACTNTHIFAGTREHGLFVSSNTGYSWEKILFPLVDNIRDQLVPQKLELSQNYPNPFNSSTYFEFQISNTSMVEIQVYDILGRKVATVIQKELLPGRYKQHWVANYLPSGVYFYRLIVGSEIHSKRLVLIQ